MTLSKKITIQDSKDTISILQSSLNSYKFASAIILSDKEINFKIKYGLQKVKCSLSIIKEGSETILLYSANTHHDVIFNRGLEFINESLSMGIDLDSISENSDSEALGPHKGIKIETDYTVEIIDCLACSNKVSVMAEKCPSCGNPVQWTHPKILEFITMKDTGLCDKEFNFEYKAYSISGETNPELSVFGKIFSVVGFVSFIIFCMTLPFFMALISGLLIGAAYSFYKIKLGNKYTFEADLLSGKWESTNDKLFSKVREFLLN